MNRWIVFFDFDGTITSEETFYGSMLRLNPETLEKLHQSFLSGKVKLRDGIIQIFSETPSEKFPLIEKYIKEVHLRNGFPELLAYLKSQSIPAIVISGGVTQLIDIMLDPFCDLLAGIYSVYLDLSGDYMRLVSEYDDGDELMAKTAVMERYYYENAVCIGDGVTDLKMARRSSLVFARDDLSTICEKEHLPYTSWNDFYDVMEALKKEGITNNRDTGDVFSKEEHYDRS
jgi:2-hydroxy-3-keto-5-methylthiopentenyl-1-phosphate phosphatase